MKLKIADNLTLPIEAVTQTFAILAKRGVGKSYTASVMAEEMLKAGQQIVAIDPTGAWFGLRSKYPVAIIGGENADVPLEDSAGEIIARSIVEHRFPAVIDLSLFRKSQVRRFMTPFLETLYRLNRDALHLFVDEADDICPQKPFGDEAQMVGAMEDVVKRGRKKGIGCTLITQRPADLAKQVLTQCEVLVAMRLMHPLDIKAVMEWVNVHADPAAAKEMIESLPSLPVGTAWFWSPGFLDIFKRVAIRQRETFDSGATPKPGQAVRKPKMLAALDMDKLGTQIQESVATAKANDPKELRKRIADLEKQLKARPTETKPEIRETIKEVPVLKNGQLDRFEKIIERVATLGGTLTEQATALRAAVAPAATHPKTNKIMHRNMHATEPKQPQRLPARVLPVGTPSKSDMGIPRSPISSGDGNGGITPRQQRFLDAAASLTTLGAEVSRETVAAWVGVHPRGGSVGEELKALEVAGMIAMDRGRIAVTEAGMAAAGTIDPAEAIESAKSGLTNRQRQFFEVIVAAHPDGATREAIAENFQLHPRGGSLGEDLGRLVGRGLVEKQRGQYRARDFLFAG